MTSMYDEITLELARLQRAAFENVRKRTAAQHLGEAFIDLPPEPPPSLILSRGRLS